MMFHFLDRIHDDFEYTRTRKLAMDSSVGTIRGRPYAGVAILWRKRVFLSRLLNVTVRAYLL